MASSGRDNALRAKASIDRCLRLAADYSDSIMKVHRGQRKEHVRGRGVHELFSFLLTWITALHPLCPIRCTATQRRTLARVSGSLRTWPPSLEVSATPAGGRLSSSIVHLSPTLTHGLPSPSESEVRASVAFQVSRLAALLSKALRTAAGQSAWDGLVTGEAVGVLEGTPP